MASSKQGDNNAGRREVTAGNQSGGKAGNKQSGDTSSRGFASMDPARQREIAAQGGRAAHQKGTAHEFTPEEARRAGSMSHKNSQSARSASSGGANQNAGNQASAASQGAQSSQPASQQGASQQQGEQNNP
jgi:uncharacterized protein